MTGDDTVEVIYDIASGGTHSVLTMRRSGDGTVVLEGQELGRAPREFFGNDGEYEYWITIAPEHAAGIDAAALRNLANGNPGGSRAIQAWLTAHSIPFEFHSHI